jgi:AcrR family transcriptional regulator
MMVRTRSGDRLEHIVDAALRVFVAQGFKGARVDQVAEAAGVGPGTIYLYARSKEALFELTLRAAFGEPLPAIESLPYEVEIGPTVVEWMWRRLRAVSPFDRLRAAASLPEPADARAEFLGVVDELWSWQARYWRALELLEKCAREWPELEMLFYMQFRRELLELGAQYLGRRMEQGHLLPYPDAGTAARVLAETVTFFAMHRHVRPDSADLQEELSRQTVLVLLDRGFLPPVAK